MWSFSKWADICGFISKSEGLSYGKPYEDIASKVQLMAAYAEKAPPSLEDTMFENAPASNRFITQVRRGSRKPRIALCGRFDMGKSRMANTLLGGERLPTGYQPETGIICMIQHISDRPLWQREDVWIMGNGFDLDRTDDETHCLEHKIVAGGFDTLKKFGTHGGECVSEECYAALIYIDSNFLLGSILFDMPGYGHSDTDENKAEFAQNLADVVIYASNAQGFLDANDLHYASALLKRLPVINIENNTLPPLRNFYFVATNARMEKAENQQKQV